MSVYEFIRTDKDACFLDKQGRKREIQSHKEARALETQ